MLNDSNNDNQLLQDSKNNTIFIQNMINTINPIVKDDENETIC